MFKKGVKDGVWVVGEIFFQLQTLFFKPVDIVCSRAFLCLPLLTICITSTVNWANRVLTFRYVLSEFGIDIIGLIA